MLARKTLVCAVLDCDREEGELVKCKGILLQSNQCSKSEISLSLFWKIIGVFFLSLPLCVSACVCVREREDASLSL